jgi:hypothetical protein
LRDGLVLPGKAFAVDLSFAGNSAISVSRHAQSMLALSHFVKNSVEYFMHWRMSEVLLTTLLTFLLTNVHFSPEAARLRGVAPIRPVSEKFPRAEFKATSRNLVSLKCSIFTSCFS